jgi:2-amino-4-hydroxy-6-hydroxymethyldihydropteridine diphosphokinase
MKNIYLGIGTNLGVREENLSRAMSFINEIIGPLDAVSSIYETEPWGFRSDEMFLNMVCKVESQLSPRELLEAIMLIERKMGRVRGDEKYSSRIIDIDILLMDNHLVDDSDLVIPHPSLHLRKFVLLPLNEISGDIFHPALKKNVRTLLEECKDESMINKYTERNQISPLSAKL